LFLARLPEISAIRMKNYRRYNFQAFANTSGNSTTICEKLTDCIHRFLVLITYGRTDRPKTKCLRRVIAGEDIRKIIVGVSSHTNVRLQYIINISSPYSKASYQHAQIAQLQ